MLNVPSNGRLRQLEVRARFRGGPSDIVQRSTKASEQRGHAFSVIASTADFSSVRISVFRKKVTELYAGPGGGVLNVCACVLNGYL